jgi:hypothetical protein
MGDLACQYGFYSAEYDLNAGMDVLLAEAGEALTVMWWPLLSYLLYHTSFALVSV